MAIIAGKKTRKNKGLGMTVRQTSARLLAVSHSMKFLSREKKGLVLRAYKLTNRHSKELIADKPVLDNETGILLEKMATGRWKGSQNILTLKVSAHGKMFFLKVFKYKNYNNVLRGFRTAEAFLRRRKYRFEGFKVRVIKPHILYEDRRAEKSWLVTDFFNQGEVFLVEDIRKTRKGEKIIEMLGKLKGELEWKRDIMEILPSNAFYHPKTGAVLLFDLQFFDAKKAAES